MTGFLRTVDKNGTGFVSIGALAKAVKRSPRTVRRWEQMGVIPRTKYWTVPEDPENWNARRRWYTEADVERCRQAAEETGLTQHQLRGHALRDLVDTWQPQGRAQPDRSLDAKVPWSEVAAPERVVRSWHEIDAKPRPTKPAPDRCPQCNRQPTTTLTQRADGRSVLTASCDLHGQVALVPC